MSTLHVGTGRPYDIYIERGAISRCGEYITKLSRAQRVMIISDSNVFPLYGETVKNSLEASGYTVSSFVFTAGEAQKTLATVEQMYTALTEQCLTRSDLIVALGGGVTGDMAGFAAATYLRGIDFVQIPTSLLAQVDSSVGGKTGVDLIAGKNLVGAFWQPIMVLIDPNTLATLPPEYFIDGMGEIIKYGCIQSPELFEQLEQQDIKANVDDVIYQCVAIKRDIVEKDEHESGKRMLLNFGHTFGHALEKTYNFGTLSHGNAVAIGMVFITKASEKAGLTAPGTASRIAQLCKKYNLPTTDNTPSQTIAKFAGTDKKSAGTTIHLVVLSAIGHSKIHTIDKENLESFLSLKDK